MDTRLLTKVKSESLVVVLLLVIIIFVPIYLFLYYSQCNVTIPLGPRRNTSHV